VQLPGLYLSVPVNVQILVAFVVAALTAIGADWLLRDHPALRRRRTLEHWLLPALTAWVIGMPLFQLPLSPLWCGGFALGGALLILVLVAEYIVVDSEDARQAPAAAVLTAVSFALFLHWRPWCATRPAPFHADAHPGDSRRFGKPARFTPALAPAMGLFGLPAWCRW